MPFHALDGSLDLYSEGSCFALLHGRWNKSRDNLRLRFVFAVVSRLLDGHLDGARVSRRRRLTEDVAFTETGHAPASSHKLLHNVHKYILKSPYNI